MMEKSLVRSDAYFPELKLALNVSGAERGLNPLECRLLSNCELNLNFPGKVSRISHT